MEDQGIAAAQQQVKDLVERIRANREGKKDVSWSEAASSAKSGWPEGDLKVKRNLKGHVSKVYAVSWSGAEDHKVLSASQDGNLIVWNVASAFKAHAIPLDSTWVMTCAYSQTGQFVCSGGLDNTCSVFRLADQEVPGAPMTNHKIVLNSHDGYLSGCEFTSGDKQMVTCSGDKTCILWDIGNKKEVAHFRAHKGDVLGLAVSPTSPSDVFVSVSLDKTAIVWDAREGKAKQTFRGHKADVNDVVFFPDGNAFATASEDGTCGLFDMRSAGLLTSFKSDKAEVHATSVAFSHSGRFLFAGYDDSTCLMWDVFGSKKQALSGHENSVTSIGVSKDGTALCTGSWDCMLKIWG